MFVQSQILPIAAWDVGFLFAMNACQIPPQQPSSPLHTTRIQQDTAVSRPSDFKRSVATSQDFTQTK